MKTFLFVVAFTLLYGCSSDINMTLPRGPEGPEGKSAYELWVDAVESGEIDWDEETDLSGFFRYLKGEKGKDGVDGKSAYEQWKDMVANGIEDPHNPPNPWDKNATGMDDFYRFLTGDDGDDGDAGKSAWKLWIEDVQDEDGLENPHKDDGSEWPRDEVCLDDFWRYLRGDDGISPPPPIVEPGQPGNDITPEAGKPNVIALYKDQAHSEYVSTVDGSVTYQVYLADGQKAGAGVLVTDMPGMEGESFTTYADGTFRVSKEQLPTQGTVAERYGSATVDNTQSAANTYVPQKIEVRLMIGNSSYLVPELKTTNNNELNGGAYMEIPIRVQRKITSDDTWENLPVYMTDVERTVHAYAIDPTAPGGDPTAPDMSVMMKHRVDTPLNLRGATVGVRRPTFRVNWMTEQVQTDNYYLNQPDPHQPNYTPDDFTMVLDDPNGFYGENPHTRGIIATAPVNFHPLPATLTMHIQGGVLLWTGGSFDVNTNPSDPNRTIVTDYLFVGRYTSFDVQVPGQEPYTYYTRGNDASDNKCFAVNFGTSNTLIGGTNQASVDIPSYTVGDLPVVIDSYVYLKPSSLLIAGPGNATPIGRLIEKPGSPGSYIVRAETPFNFTDIEITTP